MLKTEVKPGHVIIIHHAGQTLGVKNVGTRPAELSWQGPKAFRIRRTDELTVDAERQDEILARKAIMEGLRSCEVFRVKFDGGTMKLWFNGYDGKDGDFGIAFNIHLADITNVDAREEHW